MTEAFAPTLEWRPVPPGATLPGGVQVETNISTGAQRARWAPETVVARIEARDNLGCLRDRRQWVCWRYVTRKSKVTKPPLQPDGRDAKSNDPTTWSTFDACKRAYLAGRCDGVGFAMGGDDELVATDFDDCLAGGTVSHPLVREALSRLDTYCEITPSGTGLRAWCRGALPPGARKVKVDGAVEVAVYDQGRYMTVTGEAFVDLPIADADPAALAWLVGEIGARQAGAKPDRDKAKRKANGAARVSIDTLEGDPAAFAAELNALRKSRGFNDAWTKRTLPPGDGTHSGCMVGIARRCRTAGKSEAFTAHALKVFNAEHNREDHSTERDLERVISLVWADDEEGGEADLADLAPHLIIASVDRRGDERHGDHGLILDDGRRIPLGTAKELLARAKAEAAIFADTGVILREDLPKVWKGWLAYAKLIRNAAAGEDIGSDPDEAAAEWVEEMTSYKPFKSLVADSEALTWSDLDGFQGKSALDADHIHLPGGMVAFKLASMLAWLRTHKSEAIGRNELARMLRNIGFRKWRPKAFKTDGDREDDPKGLRPDMHQVSLVRGPARPSLYLEKTRRRRHEGEHEKGEDSEKDENAHDLNGLME